MADPWNGDYSIAVFRASEVVACAYSKEDRVVDGSAFADGVSGDDGAASKFCRASACFSQPKRSGSGRLRNTVSIQGCITIDSVPERDCQSGRKI